MKYVFPMKMWLAMLAGVVLATTGLWAGAAKEEPSAATHREMVMDPATGKMVTAPEYGGTITYPMLFDPEHSDPHLHWSAALSVSGVLEKPGIPDWSVERNMAYLTTPGSISESTLTGLLVVSWDRRDATTIALQVSSAVYWHDKAPMNGRKFIAQDVEYTFHRVYGLGSGFVEPTNAAHPILKLVLESVTVTDDSTVVFKLKEPRFDDLKTILNHWGHYIVPPESIAEYRDLRDWRNVVGTGPYELTDVVSGSSFTWTKNPDYWGVDEKYPENGLPYTDEIRALIMPKSSVRLAALRSGNIDILGYGGFAEITSVDQTLNLAQTNPEIWRWPWALRSDNAYMLNTKSPPFDDIRVRQAMQMALDHETINATYFKGYGYPTPRGIVDVVGYSTSFEEWPEDLKGEYTYDPERAEKLLDEAGYPRRADGVRFNTTYLHSDRFDLNYFELVAGYFAQIGVDVAINVVDGNEFSRRVGKHEYGGMTWAPSGYSNDALSALTLLSKEGQNWSGSRDSEYEVLLAKVREAWSFDEQRQAVRAANMHMLEQHWLLWGVKAPSFNFSQPWVTGYNGESGLGTLDWNALLARLWIDGALKRSMGH